MAAKPAAEGRSGVWPSDKRAPAGPRGREKETKQLRQRNRRNRKKQKETRDLHAISCMDHHGPLRAVCHQDLRKIFAQGLYKIMQGLLKGFHRRPVLIRAPHRTSQEIEWAQRHNKSDLAGTK